MPKIFDPRKVGQRGYPRTEEVYEEQRARLKVNSHAARAAGRATRLGVPNGWAGRREEVEKERRAAVDKGWEFGAIINRNALLPDERLDEENHRALAEGKWPTTDAEYAAVALAHCFQFVVDPTESSFNRLWAIRILLRYLLPRPAYGGRVASLEDGMGLLSGLVGAL